MVSNKQSIFLNNLQMKTMLKNQNFKNNWMVLYQNNWKLKQKFIRYATINYEILMWWLKIDITYM